MKLVDERFPKGLYEITSSGLTHTWSTVGEEENQYRLGDLIAKLNYGLATFDWEKANVTFEIKGEKGIVLGKQIIDIN